MDTSQRTKEKPMTFTMVNSKGVLDQSEYCVLHTQEIAEVCGLYLLHLQ